LVADGGAPYVHVFYSQDSDWRGLRYPLACVQVLGNQTYLRGRHNPQEGGPKGLDITNAQDVFVITCERQPLAFFPMSTALQRRGCEEQTAWIMAYELEMQDEFDQIRTRASNAETQAQQHGALAHLMGLRVQEVAARTAQAEERANQAEQRAERAEKRTNQAEGLKGQS
jgi:hypothetical protein